jgi:2-hydroxy-3-oxopropionate reductase
MTGQDVAFIGLGAMGLPMARCLVRAGHSVVVSGHRRPAPVEELTAQGARSARTPAEASDSARVVVTMLPDEAAVEDVLFGAGGVAETCPPGAVVVDMSTISPDAAKRFSDALDASDVRFLDAPVSGGPARAEKGDLAVMVGGDQEALAAVGDVLDSLARVVFHVGPVGSGQVVKMCNNLVGAACLLASSEAMALATTYGLDQQVVRDVLLAGTAANWQLDNTFPISVMVDDYAPRFALPLIVKDLGIVGSMAQGQGVNAPVGDLVRQAFGEAHDRFGPMDFSSVYRLYTSHEA